MDLPASLKSPRTTSQPVNPTIHQKPRRGYHKRTRQITHRRPPSTFHSEATTRRRREPLQLSRNHVSLWTLAASQPTRVAEKPTLSHKVLEMVPFDVVGQVADVDPAVLLRRLANVVHGLLSVCRAVFVVSVGSSAVSWSCSSGSCTLSSHGRPTSSPGLTPRPITGRV